MFQSLCDHLREENKVFSLPPESSRLMVETGVEVLIQGLGVWTQTLVHSLHKRIQIVQGKEYNDIWTISKTE